MRIREISITDYRAFKGERSFSLADQFTVIAGVNGRGKTAILDGLALLISRAFRTLGLTQGDQRTIRASDVHGGQDAASLSMHANCAGVPLEFRVSYRPSHRRVMATRLTAAVKKAIVNAYGDPKRSDDQAPIAVYYTTDRAGFRLPRTLPTRLPNDQSAAYHGALVNRMVDYRDFMARYRVWVNEHQKQTLDALNRAMTAFLDGFGDLRVEDNPLRLTVRKGAQRLVLGQLSDGERAFIAVVADLVRRLSLANPELDDPLKGAGVVLIDELELHLHPRWQRTAVEKLRTTFPNIQFIATTHSPFVIQTLRPRELISLEDRERDSYSGLGIEEISKAVMGLEWLQVSPRYQEMLDVAREYFDILNGSANVSQQKKAALKRKLQQMTAPYADNPAYQALLEQQRLARGVD